LFGKLAHFLPEHGGIKFDRAIKIRHRYIGPAKCVCTHSRI
jgi:hypothetical protein